MHVVTFMCVSLITHEIEHFSHTLMMYLWVLSEARLRCFLAVAVLVRVCRRPSYTLVNVSLCAFPPTHSPFSLVCSVVTVEQTLIFSQSCMFLSAFKENGFPVWVPGSPVCLAFIPYSLMSRV